MAKLKDTAVRNAKCPPDKKQIKLFDGDGLSLIIKAPTEKSPKGSKSWGLRFTHNGKRREIGLGGYPALSLMDAREKARALRTSLAADPSTDPMQAVTESALAPKPAPAFGEYALQYIDQRAQDWKNPEHARKWENSLRLHAASIWDRPIHAIAPPDIVAILAPIWPEIPTTAQRVQTRIKIILDAAKGLGYREGENPAEMNAALSSHLRKSRKPKTHYPMPPIERMGGLWAHLSTRDTMSALCVKFIALTAVRSGEARGALWSEIDLEARLWRIPAARMKTPKPHIVPLSQQAVDLLANIPQGASEHVFPSPAHLGALSSKSLQKVMHGAGIYEASGEKLATVHGLRASFRTWATDSARVDETVAEFALAHSQTALKESYYRGTAVDPRRAVMQDWADFIAPRDAGNVLPMRA